MVHRVFNAFGVLSWDIGTLPPEPRERWQLFFELEFLDSGFSFFE
jgi:hypothetical protein